MAKHHFKRKRVATCSSTTATAVFKFLTEKKFPPQSVKYRDIATAILRFNSVGGIGLISQYNHHELIADFAAAHGLKSKLTVKTVKPRIALPSVPAAAPERTGFYWSDAWRELRYKALRASDGVCVLCGAGPSRDKPLHVDHIKPRSRYPELELCLENLQVLCFDCNLGKSNTDTIDWRKPREKAVMNWEGGFRREVV